MAVYLVAGLGNPGRDYERTRHNIGFRAVDALAAKWQAGFAKSKKAHGLMAQYRLDDKTVYLLKPETYMNNSGLAVGAIASYYNIAPDRILVAVDDAAIDFGTFRLRKDSGPGGHNGLKSIEEHLGTDGYVRLRIGIANNAAGELGDYVLAKFSEAEEKLLPGILEKAVGHIERWLFLGLESAMNEANVKKKRIEEE